MRGNFMKNLIISIGADHKGVDHKNAFIKHLEQKGVSVVDCGPNSYDSVDYPDYAKKVCQNVQKGHSNFGILICYTGIGMSIIANKVKGVRCALVGSKDAAVLTREHNDTNCLALSAKYTGYALAKEIVSLWIDTPFSENVRHQRRIDKITKYEGEE